jgi:hypothetical protein
MDVRREYLKRRKNLKNETIKICESFMDDILYHYCRSHYRIINIKKGIDALRSMSFFMICIR